MSQIESSPWIYAGNCPICECGLRRVRVCRSSEGTLHGYLLCDECEALWLDPDPATPYRFPDPDAPRSPVVDAPLYGPQSHWASVDEVRELNWLDKVNIDYGESNTALAAELVVAEDIAVDRYYPECSEVLDISEPYRSSEASGLDSADPAYGADEPKPGC